MLEYLLLGIASLIANFFSSISGGGAGLLQLPVLIFFGISFPIALATHKFATLFLGLGALARIYREKILKLKFAAWLIICGLPGVVWGAFWVVGISTDLAIKILGVLTIGLGIYSFFQKDLGQKNITKKHDVGQKFLGGLVLFCIGFFNGSLSSGSGLFLTMWLVKFYGLEYKKAVAYTMAVCGLLWNGTGAVTVALLRDIAWDIVPLLVVTSLVGGYLGIHFAFLKGNKFIKTAFEIIAILVGIKLLFL